MEEIVHYKFVDEKLTKTQLTSTTQNSNAINWFGDSDEPMEPAVYSSYQTVELTTDELKTAMSNNEDVCIFRSTFIVSENTKNNTITIKRYILSKVLVPVKNLKRKQFKLIRREMFSLTINKLNGDYSVYKRTSKRRKQTIFVRKNITNANIRSLIDNIVADLDNEILIEGLGKFYTLLGYEPTILNHRNLIFHFFDEMPNTSANKTSLTSFPFLNYATKNKINIPSYYTLFIFEDVFKLNKNKYNDSNMSRYIADMFNIQNIEVVNDCLSGLIETNKRIDSFGDPNKNTQDPRYTFKGIDPLMLRIRDYYYSKKIPMKNTVGITLTDLHTETPKYFFDIVKLYDIDFDDLMLNSESCQTLINTLYAFKQFGVKLKINSLSYLSRENNLFGKILYGLCHSRNKTGTFKINPEFIKRVKRYVPKNHTISFAYRKQIWLNNFQNNCITYNHIDSQFFNVGLSFIKNGEREPSGAIVFSKQRHSSSIRLKNPTPENEKIYSRLNQALNYNKNGILDTLEIKQLFSKEFFEDYCVKNLKIKASMYIDYIN